MTIKVEEGKFYRDGHGHKVGPMKRRFDAESTRHPWMADVYKGSKKLHSQHIYTSLGVNYVAGENDLVAEWVEPAPAAQPGSCYVGEQKTHQKGDLVWGHDPVTGEGRLRVFDGSRLVNIPQATDPVAADLLAALTKARAAFRRYEIDVDADAPCHHREMMAEIEAAIANAEGRGIRAQSFAERERDLLAANNRLLERARKAEAERDELKLANEFLRLRRGALVIERDAARNAAEAESRKLDDLRAKVMAAIDIVNVSS